MDPLRLKEEGGAVRNSTRGRLWDGFCRGYSFGSSQKSWQGQGVASETVRGRACARPSVRLILSHGIEVQTRAGTARLHAGSASAQAIQSICRVRYLDFGVAGVFDDGAAGSPARPISSSPGAKDERLYPGRRLQWGRPIGG